MKKIALLMLASAFIFSCGTSTPAEEKPATDSTAVVTDSTKACCAETATTTPTTTVDSVSVK